MKSKTIATQFELHTRLFNNVLRDVDDTDSNQRASDRVNHIKWLAGHLLATRLGMNQFGNLPADPSMEGYFGRGNGIDDTQKYPSLKEILDKWNQISQPIQSGLSNLPDQALAGESPAKVPVSDNTLGGFLGFLMHHEAYHIGQLGILRKYQGKEAMDYS